MVNVFGKLEIGFLLQTDTASVLHEAMGYIRFLHDQVQVLCSPYLQRLPTVPVSPNKTHTHNKRLSKGPRMTGGITFMYYCIILDSKTIVSRCKESFAAHTTPSLSDFSSFFFHLGPHCDVSLGPKQMWLYWPYEWKKKKKKRNRAFSWSIVIVN